ncbi:MAG: hypothetical protein IKS09_04870, partial [Lachnospiraceae bacterium]|nr:hypothetical protein [Lachnospiraceae bacterium]
YHWWLRQIGAIRGGHRYFFLMCLAIYAYKCDVPKEKLRRDMQQAFLNLQGVEHENALTEDDIKSAMEAYDKEYYNFTIRDIEALTDVRIDRNKRNGRKQADHLERARLVQTLDYPNGSWRNKDGRPSAAQVVREWREKHPDGKPKECIAAIGISKNTVYKWWHK